MAEVVLIARCPEHGLHGARQACYVCGNPVEQVAYVAADEYHRLRATVEDVAGEHLDKTPTEYRHHAMKVTREALGRRLA